MAVTNEFSWSKTRDEIFRDCLRKYYFHYYGAWGGWNPDAPPRTRQLYILKNLCHRAAWVGGHVHRAVRGALADVRAGRGAPAPDAAAAVMLDALRRDFRASLARHYRQAPRQACGLWEHEYELELGDEQWKETADHAAACVRTFLASDLGRRLAALPPDAWLDLEELAHFTLDGLKVYVQIDAAHRAGAGVALYDWKTGRAGPANHDVQLTCYTLYAVDQWQVPPEQVTATEFQLATDLITERTADATSLATMKDYIRDSADEMSFLLDEPAANRPQPEEAFDLAEDEATCRRCNFLKTCPRWV